MQWRGSNKLSLLYLYQKKEMAGTDLIPFD